jgi:hypothetical protein
MTGTLGEASGDVVRIRSTIRRLFVAVPRGRVAHDPTGWRPFPDLRGHAHA